MNKQLRKAKKEAATQATQSDIVLSLSNEEFLALENVELKVQILREQMTANIQGLLAKEQHPVLDQIARKLGLGSRAELLEHHNVDLSKKAVVQKPTAPAQEPGAKAEAPPA